jgi:diketogulonate reductase-like aldo/keto reductase
VTLPLPQDMAALKGGRPDVNMREMSLKTRDDATLSYCIEHGITYNAYGVIGSAGPTIVSYQRGIANLDKLTRIKMAIKQL